MATMAQREREGELGFGVCSGGRSKSWMPTWRSIGRFEQLEVRDGRVTEARRSEGMTREDRDDGTRKPGLDWNLAKESNTCGSAKW